ncbi:MAG: hypothetical protein DWQ08_15040 [Proteobacteria bacterium]|nr:MAG: hypothetical protein DWQ08_15040 [Pseudomonadota bacterium]
MRCSETVAHLESALNGRAYALGRFVDQSSSELRYLSNASDLRELTELAPGALAKASPLRRRIGGDLAACAQTNPYFDQVQVVGASGRELVRADRSDGSVYVVPADELQGKSNRYYVREALAAALDEFCASPMDLDLERGVVESPERLVARFPTPPADNELDELRRHIEALERSLRFSPGSSETDKLTAGD